MNDASPTFENRDHIERVMSTPGVIDRAMREGVRRALLRHKKLGESIAVWKDGKVVIVSADQIEVSETPIEL